MYTEHPPLTTEQQQALDAWLACVKGEHAPCDLETQQRRQEAAYLRCIALGISPEDLRTAFYAAFTFHV